VGGIFTFTLSFNTAQTQTEQLQVRVIDPNPASAHLAILTDSIEGGAVYSPAVDAVVAQLKGHGLIVAHAGVNRLVLCYVLGMPLPNLFRLRQDYGALNIIDYGGNPSQVLGVNILPGDLGAIKNKSILRYVS